MMRSHCNSVINTNNFIHFVNPHKRTYKLVYLTTIEFHQLPGLFPFFVAICATD